MMQGLDAELPVSVSGNVLWAHTNSGNGGDNLSKLQLVQNGGLTRGIQTDLRIALLA